MADCCKAVDINYILTSPLDFLSLLLIKSELVLKITAWSIYYNGKRFKVLPPSLWLCLTAHLLCIGIKTVTIAIATHFHILIGDILNRKYSVKLKQLLKIKMKQEKSCIYRVTNFLLCLNNKLLRLRRTYASLAAVQVSTPGRTNRC